MPGGGGRAQINEKGQPSGWHAGLLVREGSSLAGRDFRRGEFLRIERDRRSRAGQTVTSMLRSPAVTRSIRTPVAVLSLPRGDPAEPASWPTLAPRALPRRVVCGRAVHDQPAHTDVHDVGRACVLGDHAAGLGDPMATLAYCSPYCHRIGPANPAARSASAATRRDPSRCCHRGGRRCDGDDIRLPFS